MAVSIPHRHERAKATGVSNHRATWSTGPGRATGGRPTLQTSSNQRDSNRLSRTSVTNVVNLSPKTTIFSEKALGLTTFVTTGQKSTRKTPPIDDVCNNTHRATSASGPHWCGGRQRERRAWLRCRWERRAWPGFETTRRAKLAARTARGRAAAHGRTKQPGPTAGSDGAQNTSGATDTDTTRRAGTPRFRPALDAQW